MTFLISSNNPEDGRLDHHGLTNQVHQAAFSIFYDDLNQINLDSGEAYFTGTFYNSKNELNTEEELEKYFRDRELFLKKLDGKFISIFADGAQVEILRDIFGSEPVYYTESHNKIYISDRIKPLLEFVDIEPNRDICRDYLHSGLVDHTAKTFFSGVKQLRPGQGLKLADKSLDIFYPDYSQSKEVDVQKLLENDVEKKIPKEKFVCPVSGGLDSSIVAAKSVDHETDFFHAYFNVESGDSSYYKTLKQDLDIDINETEFKISDLLREIENTIVYQEEPLAFISGQAQASMYREISEGSNKVVLEGTGADELFYGYPFFLPFYIKHQFSIGLVPGLKALKNYWPSLNAAQLKKILKISIQRDSTLESRGQQHLTEFYFPHILRLTAKNSEAYSLDSRFAFMSNYLKQGLSESPPHLNFSKGNTKMVLRDTFREILPSEIYYRPTKTGFLHTTDSIWTSPARQIFDETFSSEKFHEREFFDGKQFYRDFRRGYKSFAQCYRYYCFELWLEEFVDR